MSQDQQVSAHPGYQSSLSPGGDGWPMQGSIVHSDKNDADPVHIEVEALHVDQLNAPLALHTGFVDNNIFPGMCKPRACYH
jgi:hypothetical protein